MSLLNKSDKIFVAGHRGLIGSSIVDELQRKGYSNLVMRTRQELNLLDQVSVREFYRNEKPDVVFIAAAKVGGILANDTYRADFIFENLQIQNNLVWGAHESNCVHRLVFLGSSCIYPRMAPQPIKENALLTGSLEYTNRPYALGKIAGLEMINGLRKQYGKDFFSVMPTNQYGPRDNFHPQNSHVLPALIRRFHEAKVNNASEVILWGTGTPRREFMYSQDCAEAIVHLTETMTKKDLDDSWIGKAGWSHVNIGVGEDISISEVSRMIARIVGYGGTIVFDSSKPDGTPKKLMDVSFLNERGFTSRTSLEDGLRSTYDWFVSNQNLFN